MKTYQVEEAVEKFRKCFDDAELEYEIVDSDVNMVRIEVTHDDVTLTTWFDVKQQLWGFDLLNGGHKSCGKFDEFEDFFGTYLSIHTVFIPNAKTVTDAFEREYGINTVYDSFSGNKQSGYTAKFKVLGSGDQSVLVKRIAEGYLVRLVVPDDVSGKFKVRAEYKYEISEDGVVTPIPTIHMLMNRLKARYADDSTKRVQRVGENLFTFSIEGLVISAEVTFNYTEVRYHITEVSCYDADLVLTPEDPYDLSVIYMACKDFYDDCVAGEEDGEGGSEGPETVQTRGEESYPAGFGHEEAEALRQEEVAAEEDVGKPFEDDFGGSSSEPSDGDGHEDFESDDNSAGADEVPEEEESQPEPAQHDESGGEPPSEEPEVSGGEGPEQEVEEALSIMNVESIKKVMDSGKTVGVQFIVDGQPYIFGVDRVKAAGLPVKRIRDSVNMLYKCGVGMTEDELMLKKYSDEFDNPDEILAKILDVVFS